MELYNHSIYQGTIIVLIKAKTTGELYNHSIYQGTIMQWLSSTVSSQLYNHSIYQGTIINYHMRFSEFLYQKMIAFTNQ